MKSLIWHGIFGSGTSLYLLDISGYQRLCTNSFRSSLVPSTTQKQSLIELGTTFEVNLSLKSQSELSDKTGLRIFLETLSFLFTIFRNKLALP